jgi:hypothetical protein
VTNRALDIAGNARDGVDRWAAVLADRGVDIIGDDYWPVLAPRLNLADTAGLHVTPSSLPSPHEDRYSPKAQQRRCRGASPRTSATSPPDPPRPATNPTHVGPTICKRLSAPTARTRFVNDRLWPIIVSSVDTLTRKGHDPHQIISAEQRTNRGHQTAASTTCANPPSVSAS